MTKIREKLISRLDLIAGVTLDIYVVNFYIVNTNNLSMAVVIRDSRVLVQRRYRSEKGMVFEFPGGSMDSGESVEASARRELCEETGIEAEDLFTMAEYSSKNEYGGTIFYVVFSARKYLEPRAVDPRRKQTFHWLQVHEIPTGDFYQADIKFIETELVNHI